MADAVNLEIGGQVVVLSVRADPKPDHLIVDSSAESAMAEPNPRGVQIGAPVEHLELETWIPGISLELLERSASLLPHDGRELGVAVPELATGARVQSLAWSSGSVSPAL